MNEEQIAEKLGITRQSFIRYKKEYKELYDILRHSKSDLSIELKSILKKRARGFHYEEEKIYMKEENDKQVKIVEKHKKYALPDVGAIHLLLKNIDDEWHNDDTKTLELKKKQIEIQERKLEEDEWENCD